MRVGIIPINFSFLIHIIIFLSDQKHLVNAEGDNNFYPGYVGALNSTIVNLMTQLKVYQQYIDQAFQPLNQYDKIFTKPTDSFNPFPEPEPESKSTPGEPPQFVQSETPKLEPANMPDTNSNKQEQTNSNSKITPETSDFQFSGNIDNSHDALVASYDEDEKEWAESDAEENQSKAGERKSISPFLGEKEEEKVNSDSSGKISFIDSGSSLTPNKNWQQLDDRLEHGKLSNRQNEEISSKIDNCGVFNPSLIVGKRKRDHILWPWMAAVGRQYKWGFLYKCGCSIVGPKTLITSAHCIRRSEINTADISGKKITIEQIVVHPEYKEGIGYNDIAVVKLTQAIESMDSTKLALVCLPPTLRNNVSKLDRTESFSWSSEWKHGRNEDGMLSLKVKNTHTKILNTTTCEEEIGETAEFQAMFPIGLDSTLLCAKSSRGKLCQGSAGVSLFTRDRTGISYLIGTIVRGEDSCEETQFPSIYTRVTAFSDWIRKQVNTSR